MHLPDDLAAELRLWKLDCQKVSAKSVLPDAFMFSNADGGFVDATNYRNRSYSLSRIPWVSRS